MKEYTNSQISELIDEHIHNKNHRVILKLHFIDGDTYEKIAEKVGMSDRQIKRIVYRLEEELFRHL